MRDGADECKAWISPGDAVVELSLITIAVFTVKIRLILSVIRRELSPVPDLPTCKQCYSLGPHNLHGACSVARKAIGG